MSSRLGIVPSYTRPGFPIGPKLSMGGAIGVVVGSNGLLPAAALPCHEVLPLGSATEVYCGYMPAIGGSPAEVGACPK